MKETKETNENSELDTAMTGDGDTPSVPETDVKTSKKGFTLPVFAVVLYAIALLSAIVLVVSEYSTAFSDFFNRYIASAIRAVLSYLTVWIPFSLAEALIIMLPVIFVFVIIWASRRHTDSWRAVFVYSLSLLSVATLFFSLFTLSFGTGYRGSGLDEKLGIERNDVSTEELYRTSSIVADAANESLEGILFRPDGSSVMPYTVDELSRRLIAAYDTVCDTYPFIQRLNSRVKPVMLSEPWTYTHISGVFTYFTGEANINTNFPDYTIPFTAAHEMAHQRGVSREDEANFIAYLVCSSSDDPYIRYSGAITMYEYLSSALYSADHDLYFSVLGKLDGKLRGEMAAYSLFFDKYRKSVVADVSGAVNDTFLKSQGTVGTKSYGMVVDLAVAYYKDK